MAGRAKKEPTAALESETINQDKARIKELEQQVAALTKANAGAATMLLDGARRLTNIAAGFNAAVSVPERTG